MRIIFFIHSLEAGGAQRVTASLANYWAQNDYSVCIATNTDVEKDFYSLEPSVRRVSLGMDNPSENYFSALIMNFRRVRAMRAAIRQFEADVAIGMMSSVCSLLAIAARGLGVRTIGSERIHPPAVKPDPVWDLLRQISYRFLYCVVAQTERSADWLRKNANVKKVEVIPNPIVLPLGQGNSSFRSLDPAQFKSEKSKLLLAVGRLENQKGFDFLLAVFSELISQYPDWKLAIIGEGGDRKALEKQMTNSCPDGSVLMPGAISNMDDWYLAADAFVLTSRFEGFPNVLLEALCYGLPSVSTDCETGPSMMINHGANGYLVPLGDKPALLSSLGSIMGDGSVRERFAKKAIESKSKYDIQLIAAKWEKLFK